MANYFTSTLAPASTNFFLIVSASSLLTPSLTGLGAPSTKSLASFRPRLVTSRTTLMTLILLAPAAVRTTENSVFLSARGARPGASPASRYRDRGRGSRRNAQLFFEQFNEL